MRHVSAGARNCGKQPSFTAKFAGHFASLIGQPRFSEAAGAEHTFLRAVLSGFWGEEEGCGGLQPVPGSQPGRAVSAAELRVEELDEILGPERLARGGGGPGFLPQGGRPRVLQAGQENDEVILEGGVRAQLLTDVEPGHRRHHAIPEDYVRPLQPHATNHPMSSGASNRK